MRNGRRYTEAELLYLESSWGRISNEKIAEKLGRTVTAIEVKAHKMGLGNPLDCKDYLIASEVTELIGTNRKTLKRHMNERGLKNRVKVLRNRKLITIKYEDLIDWLMENIQYWDGTKVDKLGLMTMGMDRDFLSRKIKEDEMKKVRKVFSKVETEKMKRLYKNYYTYKQIAENLKKDEESVKWKLHLMFESGELEVNTQAGRIVRTINRENYGWQEWQDRVLIKEFKNGKTLKEISEIVGKSLSATKSRNQMLTKRIIKGLVV